MNSYPSPVGGITDAPASSSKTSLNDQIQWAINHGRKYYEIKGSSSNGGINTLDNSAIGVDIPAGFFLTAGDRDSHNVLIPKTAAVSEPCIRYGDYCHVQGVRFSTLNPTAGSWGSSPAPAQSLPLARPKAHIESCFFIGMHCAVWAQGDNIYMEDNETIDCGVAWFRTGGTSRGNTRWIGNRFTGCRFAAVFIDKDIEEDSLYSQGNYFSFSPYGWIQPDGGAASFAFTNLESHSDSFEEPWYRAIDIGTRKISGDFYTPRTGPTGASGPSGVNRSVAGGTTFDSLIAAARKNTDYAVTAGNMDAASLASLTLTKRTSSDGLVSIYGSGGDLTNGPWRRGGVVGVFG